MKNFIYIALLSLMAVSCDKSQTVPMPEKIADFEQESAQIPKLEVVTPATRLKYKVVHSEVSTVSVTEGKELKKIDVKIDIPSKYSEPQLREVANVLKHNEPFDYFNFEFYLESQPKTGINYGTVNISPKGIKSTVNYIEPQKEEKKSVKKPYEGSKIYGAWDMRWAKVIAYQKNGHCYMVNYYGDSKYGEPELYYKTTYNGYTAFQNAEDPNDMYVINRNGDLDGYASGDYVVTFLQTIY